MKISSYSYIGLTKRVSSKDSLKNSLGNIKKEYTEAAKEAAKQTGFRILVENYAESVDGIPLPSLVHLVTYEPTRDHQPFWDKYHELIEAIK